jgi:GNAT superfamily N-acetyltransferase
LKGEYFLVGSIFNSLFGLDQHRNKRHYSKTKIKDLDLELKKEIKKIEEDPEKFILNVLHKNGEHIIVYRTIFDRDEKYGLFFIELKVIHKKGIVWNRIRLSANYTCEEAVEIGDIEVFGENEGRGYGSILLNSLINFAIENSINTISGWISYADKNHFDKLDYFYKKHGFDVIWGSDSNIANKAADIIWTNS